MSPTIFGNTDTTKFFFFFFFSVLNSNLTGHPVFYLAVLPPQNLKTQHGLLSGIQNTFSVFHLASRLHSISQFLLELDRGR